MQHWICIYCQRLFLAPEKLADHLYHDHRQEMADPVRRGECILTALQLLIPNNEGVTINEN
jgi:hypothetical protein